MSAAPDAPLGIAEAMVAQIRAERAATGMTVAELAMAAGVAKRSMTRYLTGERELTLQLVDQIASALGLDFETLLRRAVERHSNL